MTQFTANDSQTAIRNEMRRESPMWRATKKLRPIENVLWVIDLIVSPNPAMVLF
jgi:hypothetical protein